MKNYDFRRESDHWIAEGRNGYFSWLITQESEDEFTVSTICGRRIIDVSSLQAAQRWIDQKVLIEDGWQDE